MNKDAEQVIAALRELPAIEQARVLEWLEQLKPAIDERLAEEERIEAEVLKQLLARGLIKEIPPNWDDADEDFEPIEIEGEPLSEMIIRERR